jgi:hypothetical protein
MLESSEHFARFDVAPLTGFIGLAVLLEGRPGVRFASIFEVVDLEGPFIFFGEGFACELFTVFASLDSNKI